MVEKIIYIVTGGWLTDDIIEVIDRNQIIIGADRGAEKLMEKGITCDYIVGDFDSTTPVFLEKVKDIQDRVQIYSSEKDETDTELAIRLALSLKPTKVILLGATGTRLDHVLGNIQLLLQIEKHGVKGIIIGRHNRIQILLPNKNISIEKSTYKYVSFLPFSEEVDGIMANGFKYPLHQARMELGAPYGISNEIVSEKGTISIKTGILLVIESKD